jgi:radical SAM protein with 4Fe4S-binding SPASM domain
MKKQLSLDAILDLPDNISFKESKSGNLLISRDTASFIFLSNLELEIYNNLSQGKTIRQSSEDVFFKNDESTKKIEDATKSLIKKIDRFGFYKDITFPQEKTWPLHLYITNECNLRCRTCYKDAGLLKPNELSTQEIIKLIDDFSVQGKSSVVVSGGEPLIHKDFFKIINYIKEKGHNINVVSNGLLIKSKEEAKQITSLVDFLQISLDGATEEFNDYYRGKGTYKEIIKRINLFSDIDFPLNIGMVVSEYNFQDIYNNLENLLESLDNNNLVVNVSNIMDFGRGMYCLNKGTRDMVHKILRKTKESDIHLKEWQIINVKTYDCGFARSITVDSDGTVHYCPVTHEHTASPYNIREQSFYDILNHFKEINKSVSVEKMPVCIDCDLTYLCGGGCRIENKIKTGSFTGKGECDNNKKEIIYEEMMLMRG